MSVTRNETAARQLHLWRGCFPILVKEEKKVKEVSGDLWIEDVELRVRKAVKLAELAGFSKKGDNIVVVTGWRGGSGNTNTLRIITHE
jgi:pyruvate kinase